MGSFAGWNIWGNLAGPMYGTGLNVLLNLFFGPSVNAARAIAVQVETAIAQFSTNFLMAVNPQITKLYAQENLAEMHLLIFRSSKFTFFLLFAISLPVIMETSVILELWLKTVPDYTIPFLRLLLIIAIIDSVARPLMTAAAATGDVKLYQSLIGGILLLIVPIAYVALRLGGSPTSVYLVHFTVCIIAFITRLYIVRPMINLSIRDYFLNVIIRCVLVCILSVSISCCIKLLMPQTLYGASLVCLLCSGIVLFFSFSCGLTKRERTFVKSRADKVIFKMFQR